MLPGNTHGDRACFGSWTYPENRERRDYQVSAVQECLFFNTLVVLPTGLGKTFVAAAVMRNYQRWFPDGILLFLAPTKPLVAQQVAACMSMADFHRDAVADVSGHVAPARRRELYRIRNVFFATPQTVENDIVAGHLPADKVVLCVVDEAHRATGSYSYVNVVRELRHRERDFRVVGLSATPGKDKTRVQEVIYNLLIEKVFVRNENDEDVAKYIHQRQEEVLPVNEKHGLQQLGDCLRRLVLKVAQPLVPQGCLQTVHPNANGSSFLMQPSLEACKKTSFLSTVEPSLTAVATLIKAFVHAYELLCRKSIPALSTHLRQLEKSHAFSEFCGGYRSGTCRTLLSNLLKLCETFGRKGWRAPKLQCLRNLLVEHFQRHSQGGRMSKAIVFCESRDDVDLIWSELKEPDLSVASDGLLRPHAFVGQSRGGSDVSSSKSAHSFDAVHVSDSREKMACEGLSQAEQLAVMRKFREGAINVLVATSIAEEGLDVGSVDLIAMFNCVRSPTRLVQRAGRTGRKRVGRVVVLSESKDRDKLSQAASASREITFKLRQAPLHFRLNDQRIHAKVLPGNAWEHWKCVPHGKRSLPGPPPPQEEDPPANSERPPQRRTKGTADAKATLALPEPQEKMHENRRLAPVAGSENPATVQKDSEKAKLVCDKKWPPSTCSADKLEMRLRLNAEFAHIAGFPLARTTTTHKGAVLTPSLPSSGLLRQVESVSGLLSSGFGTLFDDKTWAVPNFVALSRKRWLDGRLVSSTTNVRETGGAVVSDVSDVCGKAAVEVQKGHEDASKQSERLAAQTGKAPKEARRSSKVIVLPSKSHTNGSRETVHVMRLDSEDAVAVTKSSDISAEQQIANPRETRRKETVVASSTVSKHTALSMRPSKKVIVSVSRIPSKKPCMFSPSNLKVTPQPVRTPLRDVSNSRGVWKASEEAATASSEESGKLRFFPVKRKMVMATPNTCTSSIHSPSSIGTVRSLQSPDLLDISEESPENSFKADSNRRAKGRPALSPASSVSASSVQSPHDTSATEKAGKMNTSADRKWKARARVRDFMLCSAELSGEDSGDERSTQGWDSFDRDDSFLNDESLSGEEIDYRALQFRIAREESQESWRVNAK